MISCWRRRAAILLGTSFFAGLVLFVSLASQAKAQLITSFEGDPVATAGTPDGLGLPDGWVVPTFAASPTVLSIETDPGAIGNKGITDGTQSLGITMTGIYNGGGSTHFDRPAFFNVNSASGAVYNLFDSVGNNPAGFTFDFDVTFDPATTGGFTGGQGPFVALGVFANSDGGFKDVFNSPLVNTTELAGPTTFPISLQASQLGYTAASANYQLGFTLNGNWDLNDDTTVYVDNLRFTPLPDLVETTIFSWETPDDPGTPGVNEQFEGWTEGFDTGHSHTISTTGATGGSSSLEIDRSGLATGFAWGSQVEINGDNQTRIDEIVGLIEQSQFIALDLTFDDPFPSSPAFGQVWLHISDNAGNFFQSPIGDFDIANAAGETTVTLQQSLSAFTNNAGNINGPLNLVADGIATGTDFLRIGLAFSTDVGLTYQIDNLRLIGAVVAGVTGDYDGNGVVDAADYTVWLDNLGADSAALANNSIAGPVGQSHYDQWKANFGNAAVSGTSGGTAIPEPATCLLVLASSFSLTMIRGRKCGTKLCV